MNYDYLYHILGEDAKDKELVGIFETLDRYSTGEEIDRILLTMSGMRRIERRSPINYRRGEYTFISMLIQAGQKYVDDLEIVNDLNLSVFPKLIWPFKKDDGSMVIAIKIPGNKGKDIAWGRCLTDITESEMKEAARDLNILENVGYFLLPTFRFSIGVTPDRHVMIPDFSILKRNDAQDMLDDIYRRYEIFGYKNYVESLK